MRAHRVREVIRDLNHVGAEAIAKREVLCTSADVNTCDARIRDRDRWETITSNVTEVANRRVSNNHFIRHLRRER